MTRYVRINCVLCRVVCCQRRRLTTTTHQLNITQPQIGKKSLQTLIVSTFVGTQRLTNVLLYILLHVRRSWMLLRRSGSWCTSDGSNQTTNLLRSFIHTTSTTSLHTRQGLLHIIVIRTTIMSIQMLVSLSNRHKSVTQNTRDITRQILKLSCIKNTLIINNHKFRITGLCSTAGTRCRCTSHCTVWGIPVCKRYTSAGSAHGITSQAGFTGHALTPLT